MTFGLIMLALSVLVSLAGALLIGRFLRGLAAIGAIGLWSLAPFVLLAAIIMSSAASASSEQAANFTYTMGLIVGGVALAITWLPGVLAGALIGRFMRKRRTPQPLA